MSLPMRSKPQFSNTTTEPPDLKVKALVSAIAAASCGFTTANAQQIEEIIVTSTRRTQSVQEIFLIIFPYLVARTWRIRVL